MIWLEKGLSNNIRNAMISLQHHNSYNEQVTTIEIIINNLMTLRTNQTPIPVPSTSASNTPAAPAPATSSTQMEWQLTPVATVAPRTPDNRLRAAWVNKDEWMRRKITELCLHCGSDKHKTTTGRWGSPDASIVDTDCIDNVREGGEEWVSLDLVEFGWDY